MIVLGIESSTPIASVALVSETGLLGEITLNIGLTHSEQLLPLIDDLLMQTKTPRQKLEGIAVSGGPGSFTGLRIGMATAKGMAQGLTLPLLSVPTLEALAATKTGRAGLVSPVMDARKNEVYTALFRLDMHNTEQLETSFAIDPEQWAQILLAYNEPVLFVGDGAAKYLSIWQKVLKEKALCPPVIYGYNRAVTVAWLGRKRLLEGQKDDLYSTKPVYIRMSEAQVKLERCK